MKINLLAFPCHNLANAMGAFLILRVSNLIALILSWPTFGNYKNHKILEMCHLLCVTSTMLEGQENVLRFMRLVGACYDN